MVEGARDLEEHGQEAKEGETGGKEEMGEGEGEEKGVIHQCGRRRGKKAGISGEKHRLKTKS